MHPVKLTIRGSFWDSQIYAGELLLLDEDGSMIHVDWRQAIDLIAEKNQTVQTALRVSFSDSDLFYNPKVRKILLDPELTNPIITQLQTLSSLSLDANSMVWSNFWKKDDSPFDFLPIDTEIYYNRLFAGGDEGLFSAPRGLTRNSKKALEKHHDARFFQVKASDRYTAIAAAAGDDGLFEFDLNRNNTDVFDKETLLSPRTCSACEWSFQSVMGWTTENAFFASFSETQERGSNKKIRVFDKILEADQAFSSTSSRSFLWGAREKIYRLTENGIDVSNYNNVQQKPTKAKPQRNELFDGLGFIEHKLDSAKVVATGTAPFGTVIEMLDSLIVFRSDGKVDHFPEGPVHWRVFPRSEHYSNQLHIIYEDRIEIISFVHDYFVDQKSKLAGFSRGPNNDFFDQEYLSSQFTLT